MQNWYVFTLEIKRSNYSSEVWDIIRKLHKAGHTAGLYPLGRIGNEAEF